MISEYIKMSESYRYVGNCQPNSNITQNDLCNINAITKDNKIRNLLQVVPQEYDVMFREGFDVCRDSQRLIQPKLEGPGKCSGNYMKRPDYHQWANLSPQNMGGDVLIVNKVGKKYKKKVAPVMGKIDIANYYMPPYTAPVEK